MDLGIAGRKAIVCASSRGLGRACAQALAQSGCDVVINGRDGKALAATAAELKAMGHGQVIAVEGDVATPQGQAALLAACPAPDILVNNNAGPPFRDFRQLTREAMLEGVIANMVVAIELTQKVIDAMVAKKFGRIVNITSGSVKMPLAGLDLSSGARAGLTAFLAGIARSVAVSNVTINFLLPGTFETERLHSNIAANESTAHGHRAGAAIRQPRRIRRSLRVPVLRAGRLHHRTEPAHRRRRVSGGDVIHHPTPSQQARTEKRTRPACTGLVAPPRTESEPGKTRSWVCHVGAPIPRRLQPGAPTGSMERSCARRERIANAKGENVPSTETLFCCAWRDGNIL
jgi:3-oxoacyl-[acyl-carrier protein] reductase